jgi:hypothetical protein
VVLPVREHIEHLVADLELEKKGHYGKLRILIIYCTTNFVTCHAGGAHDLDNYCGMAFIPAASR